jgi:hypothetical protein
MTTTRPLLQRQELLQSGAPRACARPAAKLTIVCEGFRPLVRNTLRGFAEITIAELRLTIRDVAVHQKGEARWAAPPARPQLDKNGVAIRDRETGKIAYSNIFEFTDRATRDAFSRAVVHAVLERQPEAFEEGIA